MSTRVNWYTPNLILAVVLCAVGTTNIHYLSLFKIGLKLERIPKRSNWISSRMGLEIGGGEGESEGGIAFRKVGGGVFAIREGWSKF